MMLNFLIYTNHSNSRPDMPLPASSTNKPVSKNRVQINLFITTKPNGHGSLPIYQIILKQLVEWHPFLTKACKSVYRIVMLTVYIKWKTLVFCIDLFSHGLRHRHIRGYGRWERARQATTVVKVSYLASETVGGVWGANGQSMQGEWDRETLDIYVVAEYAAVMGYIIGILHPALVPKFQPGRCGVWQPSCWARVLWGWQEDILVARPALEDADALQ